MRRPFLLLLFGLALATVTATSALAFPGLPYSGTARGQGIDVALVLPSATVTLSVGLQQSAIAKPDVPTIVNTNGRGDGIDVAVTSGLLPGANVDLVNAVSSKTYDGNSTPVVASDSLTSTDTLLVDTGVLSTTTSSWVADWTAATDGNGLAASVTIFRDALGTLPLFTANTVTETVTAESTPADQIASVAHARLAGVSLSLGLLSDPIVTADVMTASASTSNDGTAAGASASSSVQFVNLTIAGSDYSAAPPGTVVTVTQGGVDVARVTVKPILSASASATSSSASATALRVDVLAVSGLAGTQINLAQAQAASAGNPGSTFPTAVKLSSLTARGTGHYPISLLAALAMSLALAALYICRRRP